MRHRTLAFAIGLLSIAAALCPGRSDAQNKLPVTVVANIEPGDPDRAALSPDGRLLATWDSGQPISVRLWDVASGRPLRTLAYSAFFQAVVFSPDGKVVASAHKDGNVRLWDVVTGKNISTFWAGSKTRPAEDFAAVSSLWIDPRRALLVAGNRRGLVTIWDIAKRKRIASFTWPSDKFGGPAIVAAQLTTDGSKLIVLTSDSLKIIDARTNKERQSVTPPKNYEFSDSSIVSDTEFVVRYSGPKCKLDPLFLFDLKEITRLIDVDVPAQCDTKANDDTPDGEVRLFTDQAGQKLVIAREGVPGLKVWDLKSRSQERTVTWSDAANAKTVALSPDLKSAVVYDPRRLRIYDFVTGTPTRDLMAFGYPAENAVASKDGRQIFLSHRQSDAGTSRKDVDLWQIDEATRTARQFAANKDTTIYDFSPGAKLAVGGNEKGEIVLFSLASGEELRRFPVPGIKSVDRACLLPTGNMILVLGDDADDDSKSAAVLLDAKDGSVRISVRGHDAKPDSMSYPFSIAASPDGTRFAVGSRDGSVELWSTGEAKRIKVLAGDKKPDEDGSDVRSLAFSKDGQFLLGSSLFDQQAFLWNVATGRLLRTFEANTTRATYPYVSSVAISHDGKLVVGGLGQRHVSSGDTGAERGGIAVWDAATGKLRSILRGHVGAVFALAFSPDDRRIVSGSLDGTIRYWDRTSGKWMATFAVARDDRWIVMTESGFFAGSDNSADLISIVRGLEAYPGSQFRDQLYRPDLVKELLRGDPERRYREAAQKLDLEKILDSGRPH